VAIFVAKVKSEEKKKERTSRVGPVQNNELGSVRGFSSAIQGGEPSGSGGGVTCTSPGKVQTFQTVQRMVLGYNSEQPEDSHHFRASSNSSSKSLPLSRRSRFRRFRAPSSSFPQRNIGSSVPSKGYLSLGGRAKEERKETARYRPAPAQLPREQSIVQNGIN